MLVETEHTVSINDIDAIDLTTIDKMKTPINEPSGSFFYDAWNIKEEYKDTPWATLLNTLPFAVGEARVISLESKTCYTKHTDIDDRYHLNIFGDEGYLIDLQDSRMYKTECDGKWYVMDASKAHTAANFGQYRRVQLVVRKLLQRVNLKDPIDVSIIPGGDNPRYTFDNTLSPWLNKKLKDKTITDFERSDSGVNFKMERVLLDQFENILPKDFNASLYR